MLDGKRGVKVNADDIVLIGVKQSVIAFLRNSGQRLWVADLGSGIGSGFVSLIADEARVYVHSRGELCCLDLFSGKELWRDGLPGAGYGVASLALPGRSSVPPSPAYERKRQQDAAAASASSAGVG